MQQLQIRAEEHDLVGCVVVLSKGPLENQTSFDDAGDHVPRLRTHELDFSHACIVVHSPVIGGMRCRISIFSLSERQFARLERLLTNKPRGVPRVDDRRVNGGIIHVIRGALMWRDAPAVYEPPKTL